MAETEQARCGVDVVAGVLPGTPMPELTRRWFVTSNEWAATKNAEDPGMAQAALLADVAGKANAWATYLMLQPDRVNWVKTEWVWF